MSRITKSALCGVCPGGCVIEAEIEDGRLVKVAPHKSDPYGGLCIRGKAAPEIVYSPDRLKFPLLRTGKKGTDEFKKASWDEALDFIAARMTQIKEKYGPQAIVMQAGRGTFEQSMSDFGKNRKINLMTLFGSPNYTSVGSLCYESYGALAPMTTFGLPSFALVPDIENSKLIVVWGSNPSTDSPPTLHKRIVEARQKGTKIIAIDQMRSQIAGMADTWVPIRSGSDGALALGLINVVISENLYDRDFVEKWTTGFVELKEYVHPFTPTEVERITRVPREQVISLAREIAGARHASLRTYTGLEYTTSGVQNIRAVYILWALTGNFDVPGGLLYRMPAALPLARKFFTAENMAEPIGAKEYPLFCELVGEGQFMAFPQAALEGRPYPVKGLLIHGASTLTSYPQPSLLEKAYQQLEFLAVIDRFMTKDALWADVVLPAATYFEIDSYQRYPGGYLRLRKKVIEPLGEARGDLMILAALAQKLGFGEYFPQSEEELLEWAFARNPALLQELKNTEEGLYLPQKAPQYKQYAAGKVRRDGQPGFPTPSGKVELLSTLLMKHGYAGLPVYLEPLEGPAGEKDARPEFPLILNTGARTQSAFRSQHLNIPSLLKLQDKPQILIHPRDAASRGIQDGDKVLVRTKRGAVAFWAKVTAKVQPGSTEANQGGGNPVQAEAWRDCNVNVLTDFDNRDAISGFPVFKALMCEVEKMNPE
ncbi:MAG: molybdopterin-dependent oxidoreductase [Clostridia bacterium]|jgi:anaerobic selenocysteine-containing dehydrogenase|nr:molybdopterin-dependent oxidoreductase [Clostridia bacterium]